MIKGKVVGRLWATKRVASLPQEACWRSSWRAVRDLSLSIRLDVPMARRFWSRKDRWPPVISKVRAPVDALIIGSVDPR